MKIRDYKDNPEPIPQTFKPTPDPTNARYLDVPGVGNAPPHQVVTFDSQDNRYAWVGATSPTERELHRMHGHVARVRDPLTGEPIVAKVPATGHISTGDWRDRTAMPNGEAARYVEAVVESGNIVRWPLSCGAAGIDDDFRAEQIRILRGGGAIPIGQCCIRLVKDGWLRPQQLIASELAGAKVCKPGTFSDRLCPHGVIERNARLKRHAVEQERVAARYAEQDPTINMAKAVALGLAQHEASKGKK